MDFLNKYEITKEDTVTSFGPNVTHIFTRNIDVEKQNRRGIDATTGASFTIFSNCTFPKNTSIGKKKVLMKVALESMELELKNQYKLYNNLKKTVQCT